MRWAHIAMAMMVVGLAAPLTTAQVAVLTPRDGEVVRARRLTVRVQKPTPEGYVTVWLDGKFVMAVASPFELTLDLAQQNVLSGTHTLRVVGISKTGEVEGETQIQFQVDLTGAGVNQGQVRLIVQGRTGEMLTYTFRGNAETRIEVPRRAIRRKVLTTRLTFRWLQTIRDITVDRVFRLSRSVEEGTLERETQIPTAGGMGMAPGMMGGEMGMPPSAPMMGSMPGAPPMMGGMPPMAPGMPPTTPGMPSTGTITTTTATLTSLLRLRLQPTEDQRVGWLSLLPNGQVVTGRDLPNVIQFVTGNVDLAAPDRSLQVGDTWQGTMVLPKNLDNLTLVGSPSVAGLGGLGAAGGEAAEMPYGAPAPYGSPYGPMGSVPSMPGRPGPMAGPMGAMPTPGVRTPVTGALGSIPDAYLADAPIVRVPALHRLDGFEFWQDRPCARIVSQFKIAAELDLSAISGSGMSASPSGAMGPMGAPMMGAPGPMGMPMGMPGASIGAPMGRIGGGGMPGSGLSMPGGAMPGMAGPSPTALKLNGIGEGTRVLLFDLQRGQIVYAKVEVKVTFNTDYLTVLPFLPQQQSAVGMPGMGAMSGRAPMAGAPGAEAAPMAGAPYGGPMPGMPYGGAPTAPSAPLASQTQPTFRNVPARVLYTYTLENTLEGSGRLDFLLSGK